MVVAGESAIVLMAEASKAQGACVARIIESPAFVDGRASAKDLASALRGEPQLRVLGVIEDGAFSGVLDRDAFFTALGRPYGWDILSKETAASFAAPVRTFREHENVFSVAAAIKEDIEGGIEEYYGVLSDGGAFRGVFSVRAMLLYLAQLSQKDIEMAGTLQERLVSPRHTTEDERYNFRAYSRAAKGMGGDFYFHKRIGRQRFFVAVGDVSGKGAAASIVTSLLWGMFRMFDFRRGMKALLSEINEAIVQTFHLERHLTGIFMVWDFEAMNASIADMGHGMCFLIRDGRLRRLDFPAANFPLGIEPSLEPSVFRLPIKKGDIFCAYTDGLVEQRNPDGTELGVDTLAELVLVENSSPTEILDTISRILDRFRVHMPQTDDATWIQIEVK
jgi:phosphoserine phosphatase RsbU/P